MISPNIRGKGASSLAYTKTLKTNFNDDSKVGYMNKNTTGRNCDAHLSQPLIYALIDFHTFMSFSLNKVRERKLYIIKFRKINMDHLLNKTYINEVTLSRQNPPLKCC